MAIGPFLAVVLLPGLFGPVGLFSNYFLDPTRLLFSLLFIIPLILLYLIRPKPANVAVPSLMFILKDMGKSNVHRLFRTLLKDLLFLLQLLAVLLLALVLAKPFIEVNQESLVQDAVIVVDISASTRAFEDSRFNEIIDAAIDHLSNGNVIILAHMNPQVLSNKDEATLSAREAKGLLDDLDPTDIPGDIPTALDLAAQYVGPDTKVTLISDFVLSGLENKDLIESRLKVLRSKGAIVEVVPIGSPGENIGIIDAQLNAQNATIDLKIQNFNDRPEEFSLEYNGEQLALPRTLLEPAGRSGSLLSISIPLGNGISEITLLPDDDFAPDNTYYVSIPEQTGINVLMLSNDQNIQSSKLLTAMRAAGDQFTDVYITNAEPPKIPDFAHDIYVIKDISQQFIFPTTVSKLRDEVENGAVLVVLAQPDLFSIQFGDLLPVRQKPGDKLTGRYDVEVNGSLALMRGLSDVGQVDGDQLLRVEDAGNGIVYASVHTNDGTEPVIAARKLGKGAVVYYGIRDRSTYDLDPQSYAVIWGRIVDFSLTDPMTLNIPTGAVLQSSQSIKTPLGSRNPPVQAIRSGIYQTRDAAIAANLYPLHPAFAAAQEARVGLESAINTMQPIEEEGVAGNGTSDEIKVPRDLSTPLIIAGLALLVLELLYIKYRGDL